MSVAIFCCLFVLSFFRRESMKLSFSLPSSFGPSAKFFWRAGFMVHMECNSSNDPISKKPSLTLRLNKESAFSCSLLHPQQYFEPTFKIHLLHILSILGRALISPLIHPKQKKGQGQELYWTKARDGINFNVMRKAQILSSHCMASGLCGVSPL